jgi:glycosyltransferase involved in cell wall biosynthesis
LKVIHFVYHYWSYSGATEQAVKLSKATRRNNNVINVFFNFSYNKNFLLKKVCDDGFWVYDIPSNFVFKLLNLVYLFLYLSPSLIHSHGFHRLPIILASLLKKPIFFKCTLIGRDDIPSLLSVKYGFINRFILSLVSTVNCLNDVIKNLNSTYLPSTKLCVIPNGVVIPKSVFKERNKFLYAGAIIPRKRPLDVIRFYNKFYAGQDFKLYLAGPFDTNLGEFDADYFAKCMYEINKNPDKIVLLGNVSSTYLAELYSTSLALIFFSLREGTPNVVLEAISHNCPVVFSNTDAVVSSVLGGDLSSILSIQKELNTYIEIDILKNLVSKSELYERAKLSSIDNVAAMHFEFYKKLCKG